MPDNIPPAIAIGMHVEVELIDLRGDGETLGFDLVSERAADFDAGRLGANTPLAQAIIGQDVGVLLPYNRGDVRSVRILTVRPALDPAPDDATERRQEALKRAVAAAEQTNAAIFAASFSGKWGDYDPEGVAKWEEEGDEPSLP